MKIGCLQFSPILGDVENNLSRADSVLLKADPGPLDLLVLPEMSFTGYNFTSRAAIQPYLEPSTSGISALWARTAALRHDCHVAVGYPEKVDTSGMCESKLGFYNSLIMVMRGGETLANYRKTHLYTTDENWAMEGNGFYSGLVDGLGVVAMGICMDLNPYQFEAPWDDYEFAYHVLDTQANVAIISMNWVTGSDAHTWSQTPHEPDMDSLSYWIARLEPLIRAETDYEIIVVLCNRVGVEKEMVFAGTSAVLGFCDGEVTLYSLLGRGEKGLLLVDTDKPPLGKLVYRPDEVETRRSSLELYPGLMPNPVFAKTENPLSPFPSNPDSILAPPSLTPRGEPSPDLAQSPSILTKDPKKLGVVPEQDESTEDEEAAEISAWQRRMQSEARGHIKRESADAVAPKKEKRLYHRRGGSLSAGLTLDALKPASPELSRLQNRVSRKHESTQSMDHVVESGVRRTPSPLMQRKMGPSSLGAVQPQAKKKGALPKLKLTTDPDILYKMEENLFNRSAHPYAMSAHPNDAPVASTRNYPATAAVEHATYDWRNMESAIPDPHEAQTTAHNFTSSQNLPSQIQQHSDQTTTDSDALANKPARRKPKLSVATDKVSAWKKTTPHGRSIFSAVDRPAPQWPGIPKDTKASVAQTQTPIVARTDKEAFWRTATMPQTANTEAFNLASISYTLGEAAMMSDTPEEPKEDSEVESWYQSRKEEKNKNKNEEVEVGKANWNESRGTLGADRTPIVRQAPWSAMPRDSFRGWDKEFRKETENMRKKWRERDENGFYSPVINKSHGFDRSKSTTNIPQSHSSAHKKSRKPSRSNTPMSELQSLNQTPGYAYMQEPSMSAAMAQIDVMYPPIPSPSLYSSHASSTHPSVHSSHQGPSRHVTSNKNMHISRPFETLRSAEALAEPVNWVDRWMPPPGTYDAAAPQQTLSQQTTFYPTNDTTSRPGLNLLVPAFSGSTETLATPGTAFPKTPADNLTTMLNARRCPGGRFPGESGGSEVETGSEGGWRRGKQSKEVGKKKKEGPRTPKAMIIVMEDGRQVLKEREEVERERKPVILGGGHEIAM